MSHAYQFAHYRLLPDRRALLCDDTPVKLGGRAFDMLLALLERRDRVVSKIELMDLVWPRLVVEENNLQVQVAALRKLLGHPAIATVPGRGYRFTMPVLVDGETPQAAADHAGPAGSASAAAVVESRTRNNLPPWLPRLFGRDEDLRLLGELVDRHLLVTVTGSGGIGKTRLAQAAAAARLERSPDGLWWVDLAPLSDPARIADALALAMGIKPGGSEDATGALLAALGELAPLIVLDNAEHLLDGVVALVTRLRQGAPRVRCLVTSQEVLRITDEQVYRAGPLPLPGADDEFAASGAVALFVARAQAADRHFVLSGENRGVVADICRRLDGIPLAIELAAARVPLLGVQGLHDRLDQRFNVLTTGERSAARRQHTLRAALEWSHQLLSAPEQAVLRRLGVFAGGFSIDAAQQVAEDEQDIDRWEVLEHLGALVDKSLVMAEGETPPRYRMLETTRLFALERLIESGEATQARGRHREHYLAIAEEAQPRMVAGDPRGLAALDRERDNLFLALAWPHEDPTLLHGLRLAAAMRYYWTSRGLLAHGLQASLEALARHAAEAPGAVRCTVLASAAQLHSWMGHHDEALQHAQRAAQQADALGDERTQCLTRSALGFIHISRDEAPQARPAAQEALAFGRKLGDGHELGNALALMAAVCDADGEHDEALRLLEEGVALRRRTNQPWSEAVGHLNLAMHVVNRGQAGAAGPHLCRVLELLPRIDSQHVGLHLIGMSAEWAAASGLNEAAVLLDAAHVQQSSHVGMEARPEPRQVARLERARQGLEPATRERLQASGRALSYDAALLQVRESLQQAASVSAEEG